MSTEHTDNMEMELVGSNGEGPIIEMTKEQYAEIKLPGLFQEVWDDADGLASLILQTLRDGLAAHCVEPCKRLLEIDADPGRPRHYYGLTLMELGELDQAESLMRETVAMIPSDIRQQFVLGQILKKANKNEEALALLNTCVGKDPTNYDYLRVWAPLYFDTYGDAEFRRQMRELIDGTGDPNPLYALAVHELEHGHFESLAALLVSLFKLISPQTSGLDEFIAAMGKQGQLELITGPIQAAYQPAKDSLSTGLHILEAYARSAEPTRGQDLLQAIQTSAPERDDYQEALQLFAERLR
ncbi:MAG: hypothetical protein KDK39_11825 [Leptospiraceae bacterium]|nr:hypothetical protein [Leptospiraceae bacterium]